MPSTDGITDQNDLQAWQTLFATRRKWARDVLEKSQALADDAHGHFDALHIIERGVGVALGNLQAHVRSLEHKYTEARTWSQQAAQEHEAILASFRQNSSHLGSLPAKRDLLRFLPMLEVADKGLGSRQTVQNTLATFTSKELAHDASEVVKDASEYVASNTTRLGLDVRQIVEDAGDLLAAVEGAQAQTLNVNSKDALQLMEEIEVLAKKIDADYEHVMSLPIGIKSMSQASKMGMLHGRNHVPTLKEHYSEMTDILRQVVDQRNAAASIALKNMQRIAAIEANFAHTNTQVVGLDLPKAGADALDKLALLSQLPLVYGSLLIEAVRRREWSDKLRSESAIIAEDIAGYREEEERRRKKWFKTFGHLISEEATVGAALNFELNIQPAGAEWPELSREDVSEYLGALRGTEGMEPVTEELSEAFQDFERPTRRQVKKAKGFKMGSIHEPEGGKGSFLLRGDEDLKVLRDVNSKLEEELKSQKSRVRKLEDLVYKQGQTRAASTNMFGGSETPRSDAQLPVSEPQISPIPSPKGADILSRQASINSRRASGHKSADEKLLARRIVTLEAELHEEKQKRQELEVGVEAKSAVIERLSHEIEEVNCTNRDLMANMEAQQRELSAERRLLNEDLSRYKQKVDDLEDEIDRILGSRDNEKSSFDEKVRTVKTELEEAMEDVSHLQSLLQQKDESLDDYTKSLQLVYSNLSPGRPVPQNAAELINELDELAEYSGRHAQELSQALASATSDKKALQVFLNKHENEAAAIKEQIKVSEEHSTKLRSMVAIQKAKSESLTADLEDARQQLKLLRNKFAEGETGSESLRQRLEQQAAKASGLATELAEANSRISSLATELSDVQRRQSRLDLEASSSSTRLERRSARDRELTHRIVARNDEMVRLLEALGLSIIEREGTMAIQRTAKLTSSTSLPERNIGEATPASTHQPYDISISPTLVQWMQVDTEEEENRTFEDFLTQVDTFNFSKFSEAVVKLRRDVEWTGKKWKAEARSYRDRLHRTQSEGHDKIAFRSFKEGDLALFLPTRNQATRPWAAFNVGAPHYFLREQDSHKLQQREWLVARISKVEERVVDLSKTLEPGRGSDGRSIGETSEGGASFEDDNPFELSDGLRWYLIEAAEEKSGAPATPGLGKSTVASAHVDAKGSIRMKKSPAGYDASTKLNKSLESRRSSSNSKRGSISSITVRDVVTDAVGTSGSPFVVAGDVYRVASQTHLRPSSAATALPGPSGLGIEIGNANAIEEVRKDQLLGP